MNFKEAMREVESNKFAASLNVANDFRTFLEISESQDEIRTLRKALKSRENQRTLFRRTLELAREAGDLRYENKWDVALAAYLLAAYSEDVSLGKLVAEVVARAPRCWWTTTLAHRILQGVNTALSTESETELDPWLFDLPEAEVPLEEKIVLDPLQTVQIGEAVLSGGFLVLLTDIGSIASCSFDNPISGPSPPTEPEIWFPISGPIIRFHNSASNPT